MGFDGKVTIRIRFRNGAEYDKFRKYVLKTPWMSDLDRPIWEEQIVEFHNTEDIEHINRIIIGLLQMGFEVYCCRYELKEDDTREIGNMIADEFVDTFCDAHILDDIYEKCGRD